LAARVVAGLAPNSPKICYGHRCVIQSAPPGPLNRWQSAATPFSCGKGLNWTTFPGLADLVPRDGAFEYVLAQFLPFEVYLLRQGAAIDAKPTGGFDCRLGAGDE
jgi:hypothetical protein